MPSSASPAQPDARAKLLVEFTGLTRPGGRTVPLSAKVAGLDNARESVTGEGLADRAWSRAAGLRRILLHHYFEIDAEQVWNVVEHDLASLRQKVIGILA